MKKSQTLLSVTVLDCGQFDSSQVHSFEDRNKAKSFILAFLSKESKATGETPVSHDGGTVRLWEDKEGTFSYSVGTNTYVFSFLTMSDEDARQLVIEEASKYLDGGSPATADPDGDEFVDDSAEFEGSFRDLFSWLKPGVKVHWMDPAIHDYEEDERNEADSRVFEVIRIGGNGRVEHDDDIVLISGDSEAEVLPFELVPCGDVRYRKADWPLSQNLLGRRGYPVCAENGTPSVFVPVPAGSAAEYDYIRLRWPASQDWFGEEGVLENDHGDVFVPASVMDDREKNRGVVRRAVKRSLKKFLTDPVKACLVWEEIDKMVADTVCNQIKETLASHEMTYIDLFCVEPQDSIVVMDGMTLDCIRVTRNGNIRLALSGDDYNKEIELQEAGVPALGEILDFVLHVAAKIDNGELDPDETKGLS